MWFSVKSVSLQTDFDFQQLLEISANILKTKGLEVYSSITWTTIISETDMVFTTPAESSTNEQEICQ